MKRWLKTFIKQSIKHIAPWLILSGIVYNALLLGLKPAYLLTHHINIAYAILAIVIGIASCVLFYLAKSTLKKIKQSRAAKKAKPKLTQSSTTLSGSKTFLVTGANRGIGLALTHELLARGHSVVATARHVNDAAHINNDATVNQQSNLKIETLDTSSAESIRHLSEALKGTTIDCVINNAVMGPDSSGLMSLDIDQLDEAFKTNASGPLRLVQSLMPNLLASDQRKVINISSDLGSFGRQNPCTLYAYQATKSALNMLTVLCDKELTNQGFICLAIHPGSVKTRLNIEGLVSPEDSTKAIVQLIEKADKSHSGQWLDYQGATVPW